MDKTKKFLTDFLFSRNSFLIGAGSAINISGNYFDFNTSTSDCEADERAMRSDFSMIGQDIREAKMNFETGLRKTKRLKRKK